MQLSLPSPPSTNGTWLQQQVTHDIVLGMITWNDKWGPRSVGQIDRGNEVSWWAFMMARFLAGMAFYRATASKCRTDSRSNVVTSVAVVLLQVHGGGIAWTTTPIALAAASPLIFTLTLSLNPLLHV